jgi:hypothetical protein
MGQTSRRVASQAAKVLSNPDSSPKEKSAAASALTQFRTEQERSGERAASRASDVLRDPSSTKAEKSAAASTLSQRKK